MIDQLRAVATRHNTDTLRGVLRGAGGDVMGAMHILATQEAGEAPRREAERREAERFTQKVRAENRASSGGGAATTADRQRVARAEAPPPPYQAPSVSPTVTPSVALGRARAMVEQV